MWHLSSAVIAFVVATVSLAVVASAARDDVTTCKRAILTAGAKLAKDTLRARAACEAGKRAGKLPGGTSCDGEPKAAAALAKANAALRRTLDKRCGGADRLCGTSDDLSLASLGWPSTCPDVEGTGCTNAIADCAGIATCAICAEGAISGRALALLYPESAPADPTLAKAQRRCRTTIVKEGAKLVNVSTRALTRCWDARLAGKHANACPSPGDGAAATTLASATTTSRAKICKACGGPDRTCDGVGDVGVAELGLDGFCPSVPGCGAPIAGVGGLADCLACTVTARAGCSAALTVPALTDYPSACSAPLSAPSPTPSLTPSPGASTGATPTATATAPPTIGCPVAKPGGSIADVTIVIDASVSVGAAGLVLPYSPGLVRLPALGGGAEVRARLTDLTNGQLFDKGAPNNQDETGDGEPDRVRFTLVAPAGVMGSILRVRFDRCNGAPSTTAADYPCALASVVAVDGVTPIVGATCHVTVTESTSP